MLYPPTCSTVQAAGKSLGAPQMCHAQTGWTVAEHGAWAAAAELEDMFLRQAMLYADE
jgi:hypothetical protein